MRPQDYQQASPDSRRRIDVGLLRRTIERQLSPELTLALTGTTTVARHGLPVAGSFMSGSCMRIADVGGHSTRGIRSARTRSGANGRYQHTAVIPGHGYLGV